MGKTVAHVPLVNAPEIVFVGEEIFGCKGRFAIRPRTLVVFVDYPPAQDLVQFDLVLSIPGRQSRKPPAKRAVEAFHAGECSIETLRTLQEGLVEFSQFAIMNRTHVLQTEFTSDLAALMMRLSIRDGNLILSGAFGHPSPSWSDSDVNYLFETCTVSPWSVSFSLRIDREQLEDASSKIADLLDNLPNRSKANG